MIKYGVDIPNHLVCFPNTMFVEDIEYGERKTKSGLWIQAETMDYEGNFVRPRWAKVKYKADNIRNIDVGDYILIDHGHWSTSLDVKIGDNEQQIWFISAKSYKNGVMAVTKKMPKVLEEYHNEKIGSL